MRHALILLALFCIPSAVAVPPESPAAPATPAEKTVAVIDTGERTFRDDARGKDLHLRIRYPEEGKGPFPLVIFSHGMGGSHDAFPALSEHLAAHGYVVIHPTHSDSIALRRRNGESPQELRKALTREGVRNVDLPDRVADCIWILDHLDDIEKAIDKPKFIDRDRAAMAGHSAGAMTTQTLAGLRFFAGRAAGRTLADKPRFDAFVVISGQGTTRRTLKPESWAEMKRPMLVFAGSEDVSRVSDETPESRRHPFEHAHAGDKYLCFIDGATHSSYQGPKNLRLLGETPPKNVDEIAALVNDATLRFLDAHVKNNADAKKWLTTDPMQHHPKVKGEFLHK